MEQHLFLISKYRAHLMGLAMLMVVFSHLPIPILNPVLKFFQWNGHFGVDIFVLLSGLGLFFSFYKNEDIKTFYVKRVIRILPIYAIINLSYLLTPGYITNYSFLEVIATITTVGYWFNYGFCDWFIPHLLLMYIAFPLFYYFVKIIDDRIIGIGLFVIWLMISLLPFVDDHFYRGAYRWIVFPLGILLGKILHENRQTKSLSKFSMVMALLGLIASIFLFIKYSDFTVGVFDQLLYKQGYIYLPYFFTVVGFCMFFCYLFEYIGKLIIGNKILGGVRVIGLMSLELYLVHTWFIPYSYYLYKYFNFSLIWIVVIIMSSFVVAYGYHMLNDRMTKKISAIVLKK